MPPDVTFLAVKPALGGMISEGRATGLGDRLRLQRFLGRIPSLESESESDWDFSEAESDSGFTSGCGVRIIYWLKPEREIYVQLYER